MRRATATMTQRQSVYGWGTHCVEIRAERGKDRWIAVKGPWPLDTCYDFAARMNERQPSALYRVSDELPEADA